MVDTIYPEILAGFIYGGLYVTSLHRYHCIYAIFTNVNMAVSSVTGRSPNLNHRQYFQIYDMNLLLEFNLLRKTPWVEVRQQPLFSLFSPIP